MPTRACLSHAVLPLLFPFAAAISVTGSVTGYTTNKQTNGQGTVATGVSLQLVYLYHYGMWAVFIPLFSELVFIVYLASLKSYFEYGPGAGGDRPPPAGSDGEGELFLGGDGDDGSAKDGGGGGGGGQGPSSGGTGGGSAAAPAADAHEGLEAGKGGPGGRGS